MIRLPKVPQALRGDVQRADYMMAHMLDDGYWQSDSIFYDAGNLEALSYLAQKATLDVSTKCMSTLLKRSYSNEDHYANLIHYLDLYIGVPNSRWRNDELFEHLLDSIIASPLQDVYKIVPRKRLEDLRKNKVGHYAYDLAMTYQNGKDVLLSRYKGYDVLLVLASSKCGDCQEFLKGLHNDDSIKRMLNANALKVVVLFIDNAFPEYANELSGFDIYKDSKGQILGKEIYTARILPTFYMIDKNGIVIKREVTKQK